LVLAVGDVFDDPEEDEIPLTNKERFFKKFAYR
jgi:hypothetical protein